MIEVHFYLITFHTAHHTRQLLLACISERDHHTWLQHHICTEFMPLKRLYVVGVTLAKRLLRRHVVAGLVASFHAHQVGFKVLWQAFITNFQSCRIFIEGGVNHFAALEFQCKVQGYSCPFIYWQFFHGLYYLPFAGVSESAGLRNISRIIMTAPMVMAVSARLNAGKCQSCQ